MPQESGYNGKIISLAGYQGRQGAGRNVEDRQVTATTTSQQILNNNNKRISALLANVSGTDAWLQLGAVAVATEGIPLPDKGTFQIDILFPWTGTVTVIVAAGTALIQCVETEVQG